LPPTVLDGQGLLPTVAEFLARQAPPRETKDQVLAEIRRDLELGRYTGQDLREFVAGGQAGIATRSWQLRSELPRILATRRQLERRRRHETLRAWIGRAGWLAASPAELGRILEVDVDRAKVLVRWASRASAPQVLGGRVVRPPREMAARTEWREADEVARDWRLEDEALPLLSQVRSGACGTRSENERKALA
jgi:hypothetical protein